MSPLDRDELAARNLVSLLSKDNGAARQLADFAVECADALLARLAPALVVPVARPEWVRLMSDYQEPRTRKVVRWDGGMPVVMHSNGLGELQPLAASEWEPCAAPVDAAKDGTDGTDAPRAPYVPKVGDVVALTVDYVTGNALPYRDSLGAHLYRVESDEPDFSEHFKCVRVDGCDTTSRCFISARGMRPATAAERVAAGLDAAPASKPVDREGLADAIRRSRAGGATMNEWSRLDVYDRTLFLNYADAAIKFLGGAS